MPDGNQKSISDQWGALSYAERNSVLSKMDDTQKRDLATSLGYMPGSDVGASGPIPAQMKAPPPALSKDWWKEKAYRARDWAIEQLPTAGGIAGGIAGGAIGAGGGAEGGPAAPATIPIGALAGRTVGAGIGGALGETAKQAAFSEIYNEPFEPKKIAEEGVIQGALEPLGVAGGKAVGRLMRLRPVQRTVMAPASALARKAAIGDMLKAAAERDQANVASQAIAERTAARNAEHAAFETHQAAVSDVKQAASEAASRKADVAATMKKMSPLEERTQGPKLAAQQAASEGESKKKIGELIMKRDEAERVAQQAAKERNAAEAAVGKRGPAIGTSKPERLTPAGWQKAMGLNYTTPGRMTDHLVNAISGGGATAGEAKQVIERAAGDIEKGMLQVPAGQRTVQKLLDTVNAAKDTMNAESATATNAIRAERIPPMRDVADSIEKLVQPYMTKAPGYAKEAGAIRDWANYFRRGDLTIGELDNLRTRIAAEMAEYNALSPAERAAVKAQNEGGYRVFSEVDRLLKEKLYPLMDEAANRPSGYFSNMKGRQSALISMQTMIEKRYNDLAGKEASSRAEPLFSLHNLYGFAHLGAAPRVGAHNLTGMLAPSRPLSQASKQVEKAFSTDIGGLPMDVIFNAPRLANAPRYNVKHPGAPYNQDEQP